jgi:hypothetical protein
LKNVPKLKPQGLNIIKEPGSNLQPETLAKKS